MAGCGGHSSLRRIGALGDGPLPAQRPHSLWPHCVVCSTQNALWIGDTMSRILARGSFTFEDFTRAQWLNMRPRTFLRWLGWIFLVVYSGVLLTSGIQFLRTGNGLRPLLFFLFIVTYLLYLRFIGLPRAWRRMFEQQKSWSLPLDAEFSAEGVHWKSEIGDARMPWSYFRKWKSGEHTFLLYQSDVFMNVVPKRFLSEEEGAALEVLLRENLGPRA
jgi:YcxB-like protein